MDIREIISNDRILLKNNILGKKEVLESMVELFLKDKIIVDQQEFMKDIKKREEEYCTYIGHDIAIPHAISKTVKSVGIAFMRVDTAVPYGMDGETAKMFFMLAIPEESNAEHLKILSMLAMNLMHDEFRKKLLEASDEMEIYDVLMCIK